jgi:hypothetical protein
MPYKLDFWNPGELHYIYRVSRLPVEEYKTTSTRVLPNGDRHLYDTHGIFVFVNVQGEVAYFDVMQLQLIMATCATLLGIANAIVNSFAESLWKHRQAYKDFRDDFSVDLNHADACCCKQLGRVDDRQISALHDTYDKNHRKFAHDFQNLDGEALRWSGMLIQALHKELLEHQKQAISDRAKNRKKLDRQISNENSQQDTYKPLIEPFVFEEPGDFLTVLEELQE